MSESNNEIAQLLKRETMSLAESVLRIGAKNIGGQLLDAVRNVDQPTDIVIGNIVTALKSGVIATGTEVLKEKLQGRSQPTGV